MQGRGGVEDADHAGGRRLQRRLQDVHRRLQLGEKHPAALEAVRVQVFGTQRAVGARRYDNEILAVARYADVGRARGDGRIGHDGPDIHAVRRQSSEQVLALGIRPYGAQKASGRAGAGAGDGLIGALAAHEPRRRPAHDGLAGTG